MFEIMIYILALAALAVAAPVLLALIYGILMIFPSARRIMTEPAEPFIDGAA